MSKLSDLTDYVPDPTQEVSDPNKDGVSENQWDLACQPTAATTDLDFGSDKECCDADELQLSLADVADT